MPPSLSLFPTHSVHLTTSTFIILGSILPAHDMVAVVCAVIFPLLKTTPATNACTPNSTFMLASILSPHTAERSPQPFLKSIPDGGGGGGVIVSASTQNNGVSATHPYQSKPPWNASGCNPFITTSSLWQPKAFSPGISWSVYSAWCFAKANCTHRAPAKAISSNGWENSMLRLL